MVYHVVMPAHGTGKLGEPPAPSRENSRSRMMRESSNKNGISSSDRHVVNSSSRDVKNHTRIRASTLTNTNQGTPQMMLANPVDGPIQRLKDEWKDPWSWFGVEDCGRLVDVPESFGSTHTIFKWLLWLWMTPTLIYLWTSHPAGAWFLGTLEHWSLLLSVVYATMSLVNAHVRPTQPATLSEGVNTYLKIFWVTFEVAAHLEALSTFLFWTITIHIQEDGYKIDYSTIALHGAALVAVWFDGMVLNRIPVRIKHYAFCLGFDFIYVIWTIIHSVAGWSNGYDTPDTTAADAGKLAPEEASDSIYLALNWNDETVQAVLVSLLVLFVIAPILFLFQWALSLYSFPCTWNGSKSRRVIDLDMSSSANIRGVHGRGFDHSRRGSDSDSPMAKSSKRRQSLSREPNYTSATSDNNQTSFRGERPTSPALGSSSRRESARSPAPRNSANRKSTAAAARASSTTPNQKKDWWDRKEEDPSPKLSGSNRKSTTGRSTPVPTPAKASKNRRTTLVDPAEDKTEEKKKKKKRRSTSVPSSKGGKSRSKPKRSKSTKSQKSSMDIA